VETDRTAAIEHQNVPVEHQGLHSFLYSSEAEHAANEVTIPPELANDGTEILPLESWRSLSANAKIAGVYAVLDPAQQVQYIGYSRNVLLSLNGHATQNGFAKCAFVRVQAVKFPKRETMESLRDEWIAQLGSIPPGNAEDSGMWAATVGEAARLAMSDAERHAYEEKKLKLRKAMADAALSQEIAQDANAEERRQQLESAVKNDDWSAVIQAQS
jgi:hypothetical protein